MGNLRTPPHLGGTIRQSVHQTDDLVTHVDEYLLDGKRRVTSETLRFPSWQCVMDGLQAENFRLVDTWGDWEGTPVTDLSPEWIFLASTSGNGQPAAGLD